ncbi:MAG: type II toxin-antitoxin system VapC family toxin [Deltaproteobacteria bacterium]|nr:type II toxin-antitoxin system VapC family toxin [Deltaproteobacteria bacterium]
MTARILVPDASVLLKWVLNSSDEPDRERAVAFRSAWLEGEFELLVPSIWAYEVGNVLGLKAPRQASKLLELLLALDLKEVSASEIAATALSLMGRYKVTFYDAAYHASAIVHEGTLVTADARYLKKTAAERHAVLLRDWKG